MQTVAPNSAHRTKTRGLVRCPIVNLTREVLKGIPFMKHPTEKPKKRSENPREQVMRFFTPELYMEFNSPDEKKADRANDAWEAALRDYHRHLDSIRPKLPSHVKQLSELCLHDAEVLGFDRELQSSFSPGPPSWFAVGVLSLIQDGALRYLIYMLSDRIAEFSPRKDWPFSKARKHWLYDEVDSGRLGTFLHRILFSDGSVVEIPFVSVITTSFPISTGDDNRITRRTA